MRLLARVGVLVAGLGCAVSLVYWTQVGDWVSIDRFSWAVIIVGLPIAIYQFSLLQAEQVRISADLKRQPILTTGFNRVGDKIIQTLQVEPVWPAGTHESQPVKFKWVTLNSGTRTARDVFMNFCLPKELAELLPDETKKKLVRDPWTGEDVLVGEKFDLHPFDVQAIDYQLTFPAGKDSFEITVTTSMLDTRQKSEKLIIYVPHSSPVPQLSKPAQSSLSEGKGA